MTLLAVSCGDEPTTKALGEGCVLATDCSEPLVCAFQRCHAQCIDARDCPAGQICVGSAYPKRGVCLLPDETECTRHSECPSPLVCGRRLKCENQCENDRDCLLSQVCAQGSCTEIQGDPPPPVAGEESDTCVHTSDCKSPLVCKNGFCAPECVNERDCRAGEACVDRVCRAVSSDAGASDTSTDGTLGDSAGGDAAEDGADGVVVDATPADAPPGWGAACTFNSDCAGTLICRLGTCDYECKAKSDCPKGHVCAANVCWPEPYDGGPLPDTSPPDVGADAKLCASNADCDDKVWCNGLERCVLGVCAAATYGPCDSNTSCVVDECFESTQTCKHTKVAGTDVDGDGQLDPGCSGGTDCDDLDPSTYAGAPERCDGKDNSCNGVVDEYAVLPRTAPLASTPGGGRISGGGALLGSGRFLAVTTQAGACSIPTRFWAQILDPAGAPAAEKNYHAGNCTEANLHAVVGGPDRALVLYDSVGRYAQILKDDLTVLTTFALSPSCAGCAPTGDADGAWTGSRWLVGYVRPVSATERHGRVGFIELDGASSFANVPTSDGLGQLSAAAVVRVGFNETTLAVAWADASGDALVAVLNTSGSLLAGPVSLGAGAPIAMAGTSAGYAVVHSSGSDTRATFVSNAGVAGASHVVPVLSPRKGRGTFDAARREGAIAIESNEGLVFLYVRKNLEGGVERTVAYTALSPQASDNVGIDYVGGGLGLVHYAGADDKVRAISAGCLP